MLSPFPARRDLFLLAAGLVLGVVLGPPGLGSVSPAGYRALFGGTEAYEATEAQTTELVAGARRQLDSLGDPAAGDGNAVRPPAEALEKAEADLAVGEERLRARADAIVGAAMDSRAVRWLLGLLVALAGIHVAEVLAAPEPPAARAGAGASVIVPPALRRLVTVRYALLAAALAVLLARPTLYDGIPWVFVLGLLAVSLAAAWVPLGGRRPAEAEAAAEPAPAATPTPSPAPAPVNPAADPPDGAAG